jgi:hypothetical protein
VSAPYGGRGFKSGDILEMEIDLESNPPVMRFFRNGTDQGAMPFPGTTVL